MAMSARPLTVSTARAPSAFAPRGFSRDFYLVTVANFVFFLNFASFFLLPLHLKSMGASEQTIGYVMGTGGFAGLCVLPFLGVLLKRQYVDLPRVLARQPRVLLDDLPAAFRRLAETSNPATKNNKTVRPMILRTRSGRGALIEGKNSLKGT